MTDVFLWDETYDPRDVVLRTSAASTAQTTTTTAGGTSGPHRNPLPILRQPRRVRDDDEALLVSALI